MKQIVEKVATYAHLNQEISKMELAHRSLIRKMGQESIVLLKNNGVLPLDKKTPVALFGKGITNTVYGGSGSGEVNARHFVSILEAFEEAGLTILDKDLLLTYKSLAQKARQQYDEERIKKAGFLNFEAINMSNIKQGYEEIDFIDLSKVSLPKGEVAIYTISRISGEGADRELAQGDYLLSKEEKENIHLLRKKYPKLVLLINAGGSIDLSPLDDIDLDAIAFVGMLGEEMGNSIYDVLFGNVSPSGHLSFSWPKRYEDVPFGDEYSLLKKEKKEIAEYKEDVFVGYRYYSSFNVPVRCSFGFGLSYTKFKTEVSLKIDKQLHFDISMKNIGSFSGKCVTQIYLQKPNEKGEEPRYVLIGFAKSKELKIGEEEKIEIASDFYALSSFNEQEHRYKLTAGQYRFYFGESVSSLTPFAFFELAKAVASVCLEEATHQQYPLPKLVSKIEKDGILFPSSLKVEIDEDLISLDAISEKKRNPFRNQRVKNLVDSLSLKQLSYLLVGDGVTDMVIGKPHETIVPGATGYSTSKLAKLAIPSASYCDGPQGLRFTRTSLVKKGDNKIKIVEPPLAMLQYMPSFIKNLGFAKANKGTLLYQYGSAFPCMTSLACSWNVELGKMMGDAVGKEMEEYGVNVWLAPAMNIHRNPLCGRNYEYFSEDPFLSGKFASGIIQGIRKHKSKYATLKHFCCNNQETKRRFNNAIISEKALREIYLKGFEIAIKEGKANALMSSYNSINGIHSDCNDGTLVNCLQKEWGFQGITVTDWDDIHEKEEAYLSIQNGISMRMGGSSKERRLIYHALEKGSLDLKVAKARVYENLLMILEEN